jgi:hypothetical protein
VFDDCVDHRAMYAKLLAAHPGPDTLETSAAHRVWLDDTSYPCGATPCTCQIHDYPIAGSSRCGVNHLLVEHRLNWEAVKLFLLL